MSDSGKVVELPGGGSDNLRSIRTQFAYLERQIEALVDALQAVRLRADIIRLELRDL